MIKTLLMLCMVFAGVVFAGVVSAGEITTSIDGTVYIYGAIEDTVYMGSFGDNTNNYNRTVCVNATVIEGEISIHGKDAYCLEYTFIADINDSTYITRILTIEQEIISEGLLSGVTLRRTLSLDGIEIGQYDTSAPFWGKVKKNTIHFNLVDREIRFGSKVIGGVSLAFTQLNYIDQQDYLPTRSSKLPRFPIRHKYISVGTDDGTDGTQLIGLTGVFYNAFGDNVFAAMPIIGESVATFGTAVQGLIYLPLIIIQFSFNFIFTFLTLIINNWWYALLLLEIVCIMPALKYKRYPDVVGKYFDMHIKIFQFLWVVVVLNVVGLMLRLIEVIRNMFRI